ncbi:MAG: tetratricopeptide repeat protein, partial [Bacteroidales bacterium]
CPWCIVGYKQLEQALAHIGDAYATNNLDAGIVVLYSALLRKADRGREALGMLEKAIAFDPLNYALLYERQLVSGETPLSEMQRQMQDVENNYLEIATNYMNAGMYNEVLRLFSGVREPKNPLFLYYLAYALDQTGEEHRAQSILASAREMSYEYVFPYRIESLKVLKFVTETDPGNPYGHYLMGNLLYDKRPDEAMAEWEAAANSDIQAPMVWRNLAFGQFHHLQEANRAIETLTRAIQAEPDHPLWYDELLTYYDASDRDPTACLALLEANEEVVLRNVSAPKGLIRLYNLNGDYDRAIDLLDAHHFRTWEGGRNIYWYFVDAHVLKAIELMEQEAYSEAKAHLERAMEYPENLEVGKPMNDERNALILYVMGKVHEKMGEPAAALAAYKRSAACNNTRAWPDLEFFQGLALLELDRKDEAQEKFDRLDIRGKSMLEKTSGNAGTTADEGSPAVDRKSVAEGYYLQGLASLGQGENENAGRMFDQAVEAYQGHLWADFYRDHGGF